MNWKKFAIICAAIIAGIALLVFIFNQASESYVERQLSELQNDIEARGDGSSLIYDVVETDLDEVSLKRVIYQDGSTGARFAVFNLRAGADRNGIESMQADRVEWINDAGNLLTVNNFSIDGITENKNPTHPWNEWLFERMQGESFSLTGNAPSEDPVELRAKQIAFENLTPDALGLMEMQDITILYTPEINAKLEELRVENLEYGNIDEIIASIQAGYIPIEPLSQIASTDLSIEGLQVELDGELLDGRNTQETEERLLQLFLDYAPQDLRNLLGSDGARLRDNLQELGEQDPEDLAIDALELMLQYLQNNRD